MTEINAKEGELLEWLFETSAVSHEHDEHTHHHHNYAFDMEMIITCENGDQWELVSDIGLHEAERPDGKIVIALSVDDPTVFGIGVHSWTIHASGENGETILEDSGTLVVSPAESPVTRKPDREVKPWDLLSPTKDRAPKAVREERLSICHQCPEFSRGLCGICKCVMRWKVTLSDATCPIHKW